MYYLFGTCNPFTSSMVAITDNLLIWFHVDMVKNTADLFSTLFCKSSSSLEFWESNSRAPCVSEKVMGTALLDEGNEDITKGPLAGLANGNELKDLNLLFWMYLYFMNIWSLIKYVTQTIFVGLCWQIWLLGECFCNVQQCLLDDDDSQNAVLQIGKIVQLHHIIFLSRRIVILELCLVFFSS